MTHIIGHSYSHTHTFSKIGIENLPTEKKEDHISASWYKYCLMCFVDIVRQSVLKTHQFKIHT